jgi:hypothetical protein
MKAFSMAWPASSIEIATPASVKISANRRCEYRALAGVEDLGTAAVDEALAGRGHTEIGGHAPLEMRQCSHLKKLSDFRSPCHSK